MDEESAFMRFWLFVKRQWLFLFLPLFLAAAYFYTSSLITEYKVSSRIALKNLEGQTAASQLRSKALVGKALSQLSYQVSFYNDTAPQKEVFPDSVPLKLEFVNIPNSKPTGQMAVQALDNGQVALTNGDTIKNYAYRELISGPYGDFRVISNGGNKPDNQNYIVKINDSTQLYSHFYEGLQVEADQQGNGLTVSITDPNAQKGVVFLQTLFKVYNGLNQQKITSEIYTETAPVKSRNNAETKAPQSLAALHEKARNLNEEISTLKARMLTLPKGGAKDEITSTHDQAKIYREMSPYIKKPVKEFVQVPHANEVNDADLDEEVSQYNEAQSYRRELMNNGQHNKAQIDSLNRRLAVLQSEIVLKLNKDIKDTPEGHHADPNPSALKEKIASKQELLAAVNKEIARADQKPEVKTTAKLTAPAKIVAENVAEPALVIVSGPEKNIAVLPPNYLLYYSSALLAGLFVPFFAWAARRMGRARPGLIDKEKLAEKLQDIFAVKQID
ncbi:hypothetical protein [uncultured Mucilaginibacter sp.]|uniref:hypothetical protein n=1 Tax=uncultured Mucilaginibacter sp. TaxID=797541 RepID=UPI0025FDA592|nr:hypothetical protein [uncultured Mucilaginibacter sp.]